MELKPQPSRGPPEGLPAPDGPTMPHPTVRPYSPYKRLRVRRRKTLGATRKICTSRLPLTAYASRLSAHKHLTRILFYYHILRLVSKCKVIISICREEREKRQKYDRIMGGIGTGCLQHTSLSALRDHRPAASPDSRRGPAPRSLGAPHHPPRDGRARPRRYLGAARAVDASTAPPRGGITREGGAEIPGRGTRKALGVLGGTRA